MGIADRRIRGGGIGEALAAMLEPDGQFIRQLDSLGEGLAGSRGVLGMPSWALG